MAECFGCELVSYQKWEKGVVEPRAVFFPAIVELLGFLPNEDLESYHGVLRSERLQKGKNLVEMAKFVGAQPVVWTGWEKGLFPPVDKDLERLRAVGIDLPMLPDSSYENGPTTISCVLRKARKERGITQLQMAEMLGFSSNSPWSRYETGGVIPAEKFWPKIEEALSVNLADF